MMILADEKLKEGSLLNANPSRRPVDTYIKLMSTDIQGFPDKGNTANGL
jgi:hypothetical protein